MTVCSKTPFQVRARPSILSPVTVTPPVMLSYFSSCSGITGPPAGSMGRLFQDSSALRPLDFSVWDRLPLDLNEGFSSSYLAVENPEQYKPTGCKGILLAYDSISAAGQARKVNEIQVHSSRQIFVEMFMTPVIDAHWLSKSRTASSNENSAAWTIYGCFTAGRLFLHKERMQALYPNKALYEYYGMRFEACCKGESEVLQQGPQFRAVMLHQMGALGLLVPGEIDCFDKDLVVLERQGTELVEGSLDQQQRAAAKQPNSWIEIKVARAPRNPRFVSKSQQAKPIKWWLQSMFGGVSKVACGEWNEQGLVETLSLLPVSELPDMAVQLGYNCASPSDILSFGTSLLQYMLEVTSCSPRALLEFKYDPSEGLIHTCQVQDLPAAQSEFMEVMSDDSALLAL
ncbi:hypothetical protein CEUSTIGMA_g3439.t1 [Chlamydomonas eustigma]|uniref:Decapping nuclease n=1 Tax=Chlamydomonas eustigma TaxID=1157962 RepID=A0A250WYY7_9CHLO|nr:hypothetical protein CEUSTIGMA_g3439.t1 [Chlamydomonas eustigma]|eukprot:GAX75996.1 hypothetical protein CEUSTIGMA_g3439.t1 [Chlamydomonas eustigma]